ncbi:MAG: GNAT family N-acetyltransferase [Thermoanaerobaculia bacterium]
MDSKLQAGPLVVDPISVGDDWDLQHLEAEWNEFVESRFPTYFYRDYAWSRAWWQAYAKGDRVHIFLLRQPASGSLVGIIPFWIRRGEFGGFPVRLLETLGRGLGCEDLLIDPGYVDAARAALGEILPDMGWDVARFSNLRNEATTRGFTAIENQSGFSTESSTSSVHFIETSGSFEDYLGSRRRSFRKTCRVARRRADAIGEVSFRRLDLWDLSPSEFAAVHRVAEGTWQYQQGGSHFCRIRERSLVEALIESPGRVSGDGELWLMSIGTEDVALIVGVHKAGRFEGVELTFVEQFASCSPGKLLLLHVIEQKFRDPQTEYFILGSGEGYKARFTDEAEPVETLILFRNSLYGRLVFHIRGSTLYRLMRRR